MRSDLVDEACRLEVLLLDPTTRSNSSLMTDLLHEDFVEYGSSGKRWTRDDVVAALSTTNDASPIAFFDLDGAQLSDDIVLVTYRSVRGGDQAWRSSLWTRQNGRFRLLFHQATPIPPGEFSRPTSG